MSLNFPNQSRSYDAKRHCVRFRAHDAAHQVLFFVEAAALCQMDPGATMDEPGLLAAFDINRDRIRAAAGRVYARDPRGSCTLAASDMV